MNLWQKISAKSWEHAGETDGLHGAVTITQPAKRVALRLFLAVMGSLFFLFFVAYHMRMQLADWRPVPLPSILWLNTAVLVLTSIVMQYARMLADKELKARLRPAMILSGLLTVAFLAGQSLAWRELLSGGYVLRGSPANAFFYLMTAVHGLHLAGGLWVWLRATRRLLSGEPVEGVRLSVQLCATYWHFLLLVWLIMFYFLFTH